MREGQSSGSFLKKRRRRPCTLLFGTRTQQDLYALDQIGEIAATWQEKFSFQPILSHEPEGSEWTGKRGLVTALLPSSLAPADATIAQVYICGPPPMVDAALTGLTSLGLPLTSIHYDKFTDASHATR